ncbi:MAG TPA: hypothetical protein ENN60_04165 [archaeon]|nr:hypothetical protein [archaeon]
MKAWGVFLLLAGLAFAGLALVQGVDDLESYRPPQLERGMEVAGSISLFKTILWMTLGLVVLKLVGFRLEHIIDLSVFATGFVFGSLFGGGVALGLVLLAYRKTGVMWLYNLSSGMTIVCFSLVLAPFITPDAAMMLFALLALYDVVGVLFLPYIKFLWLEVRTRNRKDEKVKKLMKGVAVFTDEGLVGAGDFALPLLFALSFGYRGMLALPLLLIGFGFTQRFARRFGVFPGLPLQALTGFIFYILAT